VSQRRRAQLAPVAGRPGGGDRARDIKLIHVAKTKLGMDDETYRAMLWAVARVKSSTDLDFPGRKQVLDHLRSRGGLQQTRPAGAASDPTSRKIRALWLSLRDQGELRDASEGALASYVERVTGVKALAWLNSDQAASVIESLKSWDARVRRARQAAIEKGEQ
jgi:phage gp16-like protein